jgi:parvulin-like peptidyl-prolyl isomerase
MRRPLPTLFLAVLVAVLATGLLVAGCGGSAGPKSVAAGDVAVVGDQTVTKQEYTALITQAKKSYTAQKRKFPKSGTPQFKTLQDQAIQYLVQRKEFAQRADDLGVNVTDQQVDARLKQIKKQYFSNNEAKYKKQLASQGLTEAQVREDIRAQLVSEGLFKKVTADVKVSDADAKAYYTQHLSQYSQPESRDVRHILVNSKTLADSIYSQLKGGADFATLAKKYSKDPGSAAQGGKLTVSRGQTVPPFDKVAFSLEVNELSKPVKTQYGWHIIQALSATKKAKQTPFSQEKAAIVQQLSQTKKNDAMTKWVDQTRRDFCKGKLGYQIGYQPLTDPCTTLTTSTASSSTATATTP